jgi:DHA3 family tetracycline resistance protein-like MFS transporter
MSMFPRFQLLPAERVYYVLSGGQALAFAVMFTVYTVYFVQMARLDPLQLVLVGTTLELTYFLFEVPTGVVADLYSRRLSIILGMLFLGAGFALTGAWPVFGVILLGQVISGLGYTFLSGATTAWLADEVGEPDVGPILLRASQIERLAGLVGTGASVALASAALNLPFLTGGALCLGLGVFLIVFMPERGFTRPAQAERSPLRGVWRGLRDGVRSMRGAPMLVMLLGVEFFIGASSEGFDRLGDAHLLANFTFPSLGALEPVVWFGVIGIAGRLLGILVLEPMRRRLEAASQDGAAAARGLLAFDALGSLAGLAFALAGNFWLAVAMWLVRDVAFTLGEPMFHAWLVQNTRADVRATQISMVGQANSLGQIAGGPGLGLIGRLGSLRTALAVAALIMAPALPFYARAARARPKNPQPAETTTVAEIADGPA